MPMPFADSTFWQATTWLCAALFALDQIRALFFNFLTTSSPP